MKTTKARLRRSSIAKRLRPKYQQHKKERDLSFSLEFEVSIVEAEVDRDSKAQGLC